MRSTLPADGPVSVEFDDVDFRYPSADQVSWPRSRRSRCSTTACATGAPRRLVPGRAGPDGGARRIVGRRQVDARVAGAAALRRRPRRGPARRRRRPRPVRSASIRDTVGVVTQDGHLFHDTIRANLRYARPRRERRRDLGRAARSARLGDARAVAPRRTRHGRGRARLPPLRRRAPAADDRPRAARRAAVVVILDEATAHLDSESEAAVQDALAEALDGRTALVIAHRLSTIRAADVILVVDGGRIVERGTHDELLAPRRPLRRAVPHPVRHQPRRGNRHWRPGHPCARRPAPAPPEPGRLNRAAWRVHRHSPLVEWTSP